MRLKTLVARFKEEDGQAIVLVALAMGIFLLGAIGLAVDGSILYTQRQMAQAAADAAAQAGIMSIFDGTNGSGTAQFVATPGTQFTCTTTDAETPCVYARKNGFGGSASDTVTVSFPTPPSTVVPGVVFSPAAVDPTSLIKVSVSRDVNTTLLRLLGSTVTTMRATAMAAIVDVNAPVPILITHPTLTQSLFLQGNPAIKICGGPARSIQVNSSDADAFHNKGSATVDLSKAGPKDDGKCNTGTGADFGTWGGPAIEPGGVTTGVGKYIQPSSPVQDPLKDVLPPDPKSFPTPPSIIPALGDGANGCPSPSKKPCHLYSPGIYPGGINGDNTTPVFKPGIYYIQGGGITCHNNCEMYMATGFTDGASGTNTGWTGNVLFYNTGSTGSPTNSGSIKIDANGTTNLVGSCSGSDPLCVGDASYKGILFFEDRAADAQTHAMGGGGAMTLTGTIYLTNTLATMATSAHYQGLTLNGGSGSGTLIQGEIIAGTLTMQGNGGITMDLDPNASLVVRQVALVN